MGTPLGELALERTINWINATLSAISTGSLESAEPTRKLGVVQLG
jgi:hypothetical protein